MSEQPDDGLEVYDTQSGDLLAAFTGRWDPAALPEIRSPTAGGKVTARWVTNSYDENAIGELEDVGFEATASSIGSAPTPAAPPGRAARAASTPTASASSTKRARLRRVRFGRRRPGLLYAPNSRCGWRITSTTDHVELTFTELAIENGFDFVRIYAGSTAPTAFRHRRQRRSRSSSTLSMGSTPPRKLVFAAPVFVTFESDGLGNTAAAVATGARRSSTRSPRSSIAPAPGRRRSRTARWTTAPARASFVVAAAHASPLRLTDAPRPRARSIPSWSGDGLPRDDDMY